MLLLMCTVFILRENNTQKFKCKLKFAIYSHKTFSRPFPIRHSPRLPLAPRLTQILLLHDL